MFDLLVKIYGIFFWGGAQMLPGNCAWLVCVLPLSAVCTVSGVDYIVR